MSHKHEQGSVLEQQVMDYLNGDLDAEQLHVFEKLLAEDTELNQEVIELQQMLTKLEHHQNAEVPEPSAAMDAGFYQMLDDEIKKADAPQPSFWQNFVNLFSLPQIRKVGFAFGMMAFGVFVGHYWQLLNQQASVQAQHVAIKDQQIQALTVLSLLDMPSANKRMLAVSLASMSEQPDAVVVNALLHTLKQDQNINVRLEALEVLAKHSSSGDVRKGLVQAINYQQSPMLQIALANLMLSLDEKQAVEPIKELLTQPDLMPPVREQLETTVKGLI